MKEDAEIMQAIELLKLLHLVDLTLESDATADPCLIEQDGGIIVSNEETPCPMSTVLMDRSGYENMKKLFNRKEIAFLLTKQLSFS